MDAKFARLVINNVQIFKIACLVLLFCANFIVPVAIPMRNSHDLGSQAAIEFWTLHGLLYGKDIIQNIGPYGFINYPAIYTGFLDVIKFGINLFLTGYLVFLLWNASRYMPAIVRCIFFILVSMSFSFDARLYLFLLLLLYELFLNTNWKKMLLPVATIALLILAKGTCFFIGFAIIGTSVVTNIFLKRFKLSLFIIVMFLVFLTFLWFAADQSISNFPDYIRALLLFSNGYNEAMTIFESTGVRIAGIITLVGSVAAISWVGIDTIYNEYKNSSMIIIPKLLFTATQVVILFIAWKHGFVRADGHVTIFFQYALTETWLILFQNVPVFSIKSNAVNRRRFIISIVLALTVTITSYIGLQQTYNLTPIQWVKVAYGKVKTNILIFIHPHHYLHSLQNQLAENISLMTLPTLKSLAGNQSVGYYGFLPAPVVYNGLNYVPNPATISFAAWNAWIMQAEAKFFRDDKSAPLFLLFDLQGIDNRLAAQDNSLAQLEILHRYDVITTELDNLILKRTENMPSLKKQKLYSTHYKLNEWMDIPHNEGLTWVAIQFKQKALSNLMSLIYKPSFYSISLWLTDGSIKAYKFIPKMAATGFVINPLILGNSDVVNLLDYLKSHDIIDSSVPLNQTIKFKITCDIQEISCNKQAVVKFYSINGLKNKF